LVVIVGTQSSGSSAIAGVAYHVGVWMGTDLGGRYGRNPNTRCGFEDRTITRIVQRHVPFMRPRRGSANVLRRSLTHRIRTLQQEAASHGTIAGIKLPRLSFVGDILLDLCGDGLRVIDCDRPLEDSIQSVKRRMPNNKNCERWQTWLWNGKHAFLATVPEDRRLTVEYYATVRDPHTTAERITAFLGLSPTPEQMQRAVAIIHPTMKHVG